MFFFLLVFIVFMAESNQSITLIQNYERVAKKLHTFTFRVGSINIAEHGEKILRTFFSQKTTW
jgi:hypothetical protein